MLEASVKQTTDVFGTSLFGSASPRIRTAFAARQRVLFNRCAHRFNRGARMETYELMNWQLQYISPNKPLSPVQHRTAHAGPTGEVVLKQQLSPRRLKSSSIGRAYTQQRLVVCCCACCSLSGTANMGFGERTDRRPGDRLVSY